MGLTTVTNDDVALFSKDGRTWADGTRVDWSPNERVTKIVIGSPEGEGADEKKQTIEIPPDLSARYPRLTHLYLWGIANLKALPELPKHLECLDVRRCAALASLPQLPDTLEVLDLGACSKLAALPAAPKELTRFFFNDCTSLKPRLLENFLADLHAEAPSHGPLIEIDGSRCPAVVTIEEFPRTLRKLVLSGCERLESVEALAQFEKLAHLNLAGCPRLTSLPDLPDGLQYLELRGSDNLADFIGQDIGPYDRGSDERVNVVNTFYSRRKFGKEMAVSAHAKLLLLGDGRGGKSTLAKRLQWDCLTAAQQADPAFKHLKPDPRQRFTHKVELSEWKTRLQLDPEKARDVNARAASAHLEPPCDDRHTVDGSIQVWDFGGQEIYHQTHGIFASEGTVFLIVWSAKEPTERELLEEMPNGVDQRDWLELNRRRSLDYWLDYVERLGGRTPRSAKPKIVLVRTHCETHAALPSWKQRAPKHAADRLYCYDVDSLDDNCATSPDYRRLVQTIREHCGAEAVRIGILKPGFYVQASADVGLQLRENDALLRDGKKPKHLLLPRATWNDTLKQRHRSARPSAPALDTDDIDAVTGYLHDAGFVFHMRGGNEEAIIVDQRLASDLIYRILLPGNWLGNRILEHGGRFYHVDLEHAADWSELATDLDREQLLRYMEQCGIIVRLLGRERHHEGKDLYLATEKWLLPRFTSVEDRLNKEMDHIFALSGRHEQKEFWFEDKEISEFDFKSLMAHLARRLGLEAIWFRGGFQVAVTDERATWCFYLNGNRRTTASLDASMGGWSRRPITSATPRNESPMCSRKKGARLPGGRWGDRQARERLMRSRLTSAASTSTAAQVCGMSPSPVTATMKPSWHRSVLRSGISSGPKVWS